MIPFVDTASFIVIAFLVLLGLISMCWVSSYYLLQYLDIIAIRKPKTSIFIGILCVIGLTVSYPLVILTYNVSLFPDYPHSGEIMSILILLNYIGLYHVFTFRAFKVYVNIKWNQALEDQKWRLYIDPNETNWYLKHKHSWGSSKRLSTLLLIHLLFWALLAFIFVFIGGPDAKRTVAFILGGSGLLPTIFDIVMYIKFPKFDDIWGITKEIKYTLSLEIFVVIIMPFLWFIMNPRQETIGFLILSTGSPFCLFIYVFLIHFRPLRAAVLPTNPLSAIKYLEFVSDAKCMNDSELSREASAQTVQKESNEKTINIKAVLSHEIGFNLFARHLSKEFCIESMLFLVETQQWISSISSEIKDIVSFNLPNNAPKSKIIQMDENDEYIQFAKLFKKYIANDSYFCINISGEARKRLYQETGYNDDDKQSHQQIAQYLKQNGTNQYALCHLFVAARKQVFRLIDAAFFRFTQSECFQELQIELTSSTK